METHRIKMKIGVHEFEAEGPKDIVTAQFNAFLKAVEKIPGAALAAALAEPPPSPPTPATPQEVSNAILERVFRPGDTLTLAALPSGDNAKSDAMLALLYGYLKIKGEISVTGTSLMKSAKQSGVIFERVDRIMDTLMPAFVLAAGVKKARRYQLNNPGIVRAEEIIKAILQ